MANNTITAHPYISFEGNCREAMNFYKEALGGELHIMNFEDAPNESPKGYEKKVMHSELRSGDLVVMGADCPPEHSCGKQGNISILIDADNIEKAKCMFEKLSEGGVVHMPFEKTFWASGFGAFADKFGVFWSINCD